MYPREQLEVLERHKAVVRLRITIQRADITRHMTAVLRPVEVVGRVRARWDAIPLPLRMAIGPLLLALQRSFWRRFHFAGTAMAWAPPVWRIVRWAYPLLRASSFFRRGEDTKEKRLHLLRERARILRERAAGEP